MRVRILGNVRQCARLYRLIIIEYVPKKLFLVKLLKCSAFQLKVWFQNRRRKDKVRSQEEAATTFNGLDYSEDS